MLKEDQSYLSSKQNQKSPNVNSQTVRTPVKRLPIENRPIEKRLDPQKLQVSISTSFALPRFSEFLVQLMNVPFILIQLEGKIVDHWSTEERNSVTQDRKASGDDSPNKISENIVKCLLNVFSRMSSKRTRSSAETLSSLPAMTFCDSSVTAQFKDPYAISLKFGKRDIGPYKHLFAVEAPSINPNRSTVSVFLVRRLK